MSIRSKYSPQRRDIWVSSVRNVKAEEFLKQRLLGVEVIVVGNRCVCMDWWLKYWCYWVFRHVAVWSRHKIGTVNIARVEWMLPHVSLLVLSTVFRSAGGGGGFASLWSDVHTCMATLQRNTARPCVIYITLCCRCNVAIQCFRLP
jgi:hypothetical protein